MTAASLLNRKRFRQTVRRGIGGHCDNIGQRPDFFQPKSFGTMNILHAITMPMPRVQPADKLKVGKYIPASLSNQVRTATVVREWNNGNDVDFDGIAPGVY